jgi:hypothetical protein
MSSARQKNTPSGDYKDNSYKSRDGQKGESVPVTTDDVDDSVDPVDADSDATLGNLSTFSSFTTYRSLYNS